MKKHYRSMRWMTSMAAIFICLLFFASCEEKESAKVPFDPSKPVVITSFTPDSGRVATQMLIRGENFGFEKDSISVFINGKKAVVIGVTEGGTIIYCIVPSMKEVGVIREDGETIDVDVKVIVRNVESNALEKKLAYRFSQNVSTFLGFTDQDGQSPVVDGDFEDAQFNTPAWLAFDEETAPGTPRNFFLIEESTEPDWNNGSLRFIDMANKRVTKVFSAGNGVDRPRTIAFTLKWENGQMVPNSVGDTMIIANDSGNWGDRGTVIIPRNTQTRRFDKPGVTTPWQVVMRHKQCNGGATHPTTGDYWFNSYEKGQLYKVWVHDTIPWRYGGKSAADLNTDGQEGTKCVIDKVGDNNWEFCIQIAPSGNFAYCVVRNQHYIIKLIYNVEKKIFESQGPFAGAKQKSGFQDGMLLSALFNTPQQGAFDDDDNFYVCDGRNNCIRKITPQGQVSTFAGRPNSSAGYSDGALRDAQFSMPLGIIYDNINQTFYVGDRDNHRIRSIKVE
jgi:hypothetical protein